MRHRVSRDSKGKILTARERRIVLLEKIQEWAPAYGKWMTTEEIFTNLHHLHCRIYGSLAKPRDVLLEDLKKLRTNYEIQSKTKDRKTVWRTR